MKKKIACVIYSMGSGGAEKVLSLVAHGLSDVYDITVVTLSQSSDFYPLTNLKRIQLSLDKPSKTWWQGVTNNIERLRQLRKTLKNFDCIITFMTQTNVLTLLALYDHKNIIVTEHNAREILSSRLWRILQESVYPRAKKVVCVSQSVAYDYPFCSNLHVIPNPLDPEIDSLANEDIPVSLPQRFFVAVGRCDDTKGHYRVIEAWRQRNIKDVALVIVGDGEKRELWEHETSHEEIIFVGRQKNPYPFIARSLGLVFGSVSEGFGNVIIEALRLKKEVIAFDCSPAVCELLHDTPYLIPCRDSYKMAQAMDEVAQKKGYNHQGYHQSLAYECDNIVNEWKKIL